MKRFFLFVLGFSLIFGIALAQGNVQVKKYAVAIKTANVRSMPSTQGEILFVAQAGEKMEVLEDLGTWLKVRRADGTVGFIWAKLVRVEVEKVILPPKPHPRPQPKPTAPVKPAQALAPSVSRFQLSLNFSYSLVNPEEYYAFSQLVNDYYEVFAALFSSLGYSTKIEGELEGVKKTLGGTLEARYLFSKNIGLGLGFMMVSGRKGGDITFKYSSSTISASVKTDQTLSADIYAPYLALHFVYPFEIGHIDTFLGGGYFIGKFSMDYDYSDGGYDHFRISKSSPGFLGGLRIGLNISPGMGVFIEGKYTMVKFKNMEGDHITSSDTTHGTVYYFQYSGDPSTPGLMVSPREPSPSPPIKFIRPAEFNFSGPSFGIGFFYKF